MDCNTDLCSFVKVGFSSSTETVSIHEVCFLSPLPDDGFGTNPGAEYRSSSVIHLVCDWYVRKLKETIISENDILKWNQSLGQGSERRRRTIITYTYADQNKYVLYLLEILQAVDAAKASKSISLPFTFDGDVFIGFRLVHRISTIVACKHDHCKSFTFNTKGNEFWK